MPLSASRISNKKNIIDATSFSFDHSFISQHVNYQRIHYKINYFKEQKFSSYS